MVWDEFGGMWLREPAALLLFGLAVFAVLGGAHAWIAVAAESPSPVGATPADARTSMIVDLLVAFGAVQDSLDRGRPAEVPRTRTGRTGAGMARTLPATSRRRRVEAGRAQGGGRRRSAGVAL